MKKDHVFQVNFSFTKNRPRNRILFYNPGFGNLINQNKSEDVLELQVSFAFVLQRLERRSVWLSGMPFVIDVLLVKYKKNACWLFAWGERCFSDEGTHTKFGTGKDSNEYWTVLGHDYGFEGKRVAISVSVDGFVCIMRSLEMFLARF